MIRIFFFDPVHSFCDCILMGTGECGKYQRTAVRASRVYVHAGEFFIFFADIRHIGEVQFRIYPLCIHIHSQCDDIYVTGTLTVSEQCSFDTVCTGKKSKFRVCHTTSTVVVRMQRYDNIFSVIQIVAHVLDLACIYVRHGMFYGYRQVDDCFLLCGWFPYIQNGVTYFQCIFRFGSGKAFRAVLEQEVSVCLISQFL